MPTLAGVSNAPSGGSLLSDRLGTDHSESVQPTFWPCVRGILRFHLSGMSLRSVSITNSPLRLTCSIMMGAAAFTLSALAEMAGEIAR